MKKEEWCLKNNFKEGSEEVCENCIHARIDTECWYYCDLMEEEGVIRDPQLKDSDEDGNMVYGTSTCDRFEYN